MEFTLEMLLPLAGILLGAKLAARLSQRIGLPAVFGELVLGLLLGPSLLGWVEPSPTLHLMADLGVILLMFIAGIETDLEAVRGVGRASLLSAIGGVLLPLAGGTLVGMAFHLEFHHALFLGAVLTATSVSISAQTLREMGLFNSIEGVTTLGAAIIDDVLGVLVFAVVMSLSGESNLFLTLGKMILFFPVAWFLGDKVLPWVLKWMRKINHLEASLAVVFSLVLAYAWAAEALGSVATITGAYLFGVLFARHAKHEHELHTGMSSLGFGFFIPVFFVNIGLQADLTGLASAPALAGLLTIIAILTKIVGSGVGARLGGLKQKAALMIGCGMVSRGEVALVLASAGLAAGMLDAALFSQLVVVTLATTLVTPPLLHLVHSRISSRVEAAGQQIEESALQVLEELLPEEGSLAISGD